MGADKKASPATEEPAMALMADAGAVAAELRASVARKGEALARFLKLVDSFKEIIAEEPKRYAAAQKALAETGGLSKKVILESAEAQIKELKARQGVFAAQVDIRRTELKGMQRRAEDFKTQIASLTETIRKLEEGQKAVLAQSVAEEDKIKQAEAAFAKALGEVEAEIRETSKKIEANVQG